MESVQSNLPAHALDASVSAEGDAIVVSLRGEADRFTLPVIGQVLERVIADHDGSTVARPIVPGVLITAFPERGHPCTSD